MKTLLTIFVLLASGFGVAQTTTAMITAPEPRPEVVTPVLKVTLQKPEHKFFDKKNVMLFGAAGATLAFDAISTRHFLAEGLPELNPIARPFVKTNLGTVGYFAASYVTLSGGMYLAHKKGWHRLERFAPGVLSVWEGLLAGRNYRLNHWHK